MVANFGYHHDRLGTAIVSHDEGNRVQAMTSQTIVNLLGCLGHSIWHTAAYTLINEST